MCSFTKLCCATVLLILLVLCSHDLLWMAAVIVIPKKKKIGKMSARVHQLNRGPSICWLNAMKYGRKLVQQNLMQNNIRGKTYSPNLFIWHLFYPLIFTQISFTHILAPTHLEALRCFVQQRELGTASCGLIMGSWLVLDKLFKIL